jgi:hypothetical protein
VPAKPAVKFKATTAQSRPGHSPAAGTATTHTHAEMSMLQYACLFTALQACPNLASLAVAGIGWSIAGIRSKSDCRIAVAARRTLTAACFRGSSDFCVFPRRRDRGSGADDGNSHLVGRDWSQ